MEEKEMNEFEAFALNFPVVKNVSPKTIASEIATVQPALEPPIKEKYTNHWGEEVRVYQSGLRVTHSTGDHRLYGEYGHAFGQGFYVVDEDGKMVFRGDERYYQIMEKCNDMHLLMRHLQEKFSTPDFHVERGRGDRLMVNDKVIKGVLVYPGCLRKMPLETAAEFYEEEIRRDIESGRIQPGKFGV